MPVRGGAIHEANRPGSRDWPHQAGDKRIVVGRRQELVAAARPFLGGQDVALGVGLDRGEFADPAVERDMRQCDAKIDPARSMMRFHQRSTPERASAT